MEKSLPSTASGFAQEESFFSRLFSWGRSRAQGHLSRGDYQFAAATAAREIMEVILGKMAARQATLASVKIFGQQMAADHGMAEAKLQSIAAQQEAACPEQPTPQQQQEIDRLSRLHGYAFDQEYIALMRKIHTHDLKLFRRAAHQMENPELRSFAEGTSYLLQHHLQMEKYLAVQVREESQYNYINNH